MRFKQLACHLNQHKGSIKKHVIQHIPDKIFHGTIGFTYISATRDKKSLQVIELVGPALSLSPFGFVFQRKRGDSNPRYSHPYGSLANCWFQPLTHTSLWILLKSDANIQDCFQLVKEKMRFWHEYFK